MMLFVLRYSLFFFSVGGRFIHSSHNNIFSKSFLVKSFLRQNKKQYHHNIEDDIEDDIEDE